MFGIIKKILSRLLFYLFCLVGGLTFIATIFLFSLDENLTYSFISFLLFALGIVLFMMASMAVLTGQVVSTILWRTEDIPIDKLTVKIKKKDYPAEYWKVLLQYIFYSILCICVGLYVFGQQPPFWEQEGFKKALSITVYIFTSMVSLGTFRIEL